MRQFHYDEFTGEFLAWTDAMADPLDNPDGKDDLPWLVPRHATLIPPPPLVAGNVLVFRDEKWGYLLPDDPDGEPSPEPLDIPPELQEELDAANAAAAESEPAGDAG